MPACNMHSTKIIDLEVGAAFERHFNLIDCHKT